MDEREAGELLDAEMARLRARRYDDLVRLIDNQEDYWVTASDFLLAPDESFIGE